MISLGLLTFKIEFYQKTEKTEGINLSLLSFGNGDSVYTFQVCG